MQKIGVDIEGIITPKELKKVAVRFGYKTTANLVRDLLKNFLNKQPTGLK